VSIERSTDEKRPAAGAGGGAVAGLDELSRRLLERLRRAGARGLGRAELATPAGGEGPDQEVDRALERLRTAGLAAPWRERWTSAEAAGWLAGTVENALSGGGVTVRAGEEELAVGSDALAGAGRGDLVLVRPLRGRRRLIAGRSLQEAAVVAVLGAAPAPAAGAARESIPEPASREPSRREPGGSASRRPPPEAVSSEAGPPSRDPAAPPPHEPRSRPETAPEPRPIARAAEAPPQQRADRPRSPRSSRSAPPAPVPAPIPGVIGAVVIEEGVAWLAPYDWREQDFDLDGADGVPDGHFVVAEPVPRPAGLRPERARVIEVLGAPERPGVDTEVVLRHYRIPLRYPEAALAEADALPAEPRPEDLTGRLDLRDRTVVTIDGADARDFDDALSVEPLGDGWRLGVHIADVGHYVREGGALDREAARRGTSVYFPGRVVPMLPEALSNGLCSLRPGVPRLTVSAFLDVGRDGRVRRRRFAETVIASARRLTYEEVRRVIEEERPRDARDYGAVLPILADLRELMAALHGSRRERGSLDFDLPEGDVELDTDGYTVGVQPGHRTVAHRIVEETMIAANEAVAAELESSRVPALYRIHLPPAPEDLDVLAGALERLGIEPPEGGDEVTPAELAAVQDAAAGQPWETFVNSLVMLTLKGAFYSHDNRGHFALASERYTHFTSPIRRYPDLVVHRRLKTLVREGVKAARAGGGELEAVAAAASEAERRATRAERDVLQWKKVRFLEERVGETFGGRITGVQKYGLFVQLDRYLVDGLVPVRTLGREFFRFDAEGHRLVGESTGRAFRLGDAVDVTLEGVSAQHRGLDLTLAT
jgi:ribonuclease R